MWLVLVKLFLGDLTTFFNNVSWGALRGCRVCLELSSQGQHTITFDHTYNID